MEPAPPPPPGLHAGGFRIVDAAAVWFASVVLGAILFAAAVGITGDDPDDPGWVVTAAAVAGQFGTFALGTWIVARVRATGSLGRDLGFVVRARDWWAIPAGTGLALALILVFAPLLVLVDDDQGVVEDLERAAGAELVVLTVTALVLAPVLEELLFRGLLLRALCRRYRAAVAIWVSAVAFGMVHLLDPSLGTLVRVPLFVVLGAVSGREAVRTGNLSRSIGLHVGFNLPTVAVLVLG